VGDDLFVSDFINRARLIFIDVDVKVLSFNLLSDLKMWVLNDKHQHAIMCGVYNQKEYLGKFLVNRDVLVCDLSLRKLPVFLELKRTR
jgi:hypothetical protein